MKKYKNIPVPLRLLYDDTSNSANVTNDINAYYRMLIKALDKAAKIFINRYQIFINFDGRRTKNSEGKFNKRSQSVVIGW